MKGGSPADEACELEWSGGPFAGRERLRAERDRLHALLERAKDALETPFQGIVPDDFAFVIDALKAKAQLRAEVLADIRNELAK